MGIEWKSVNDELPQDEGQYLVVLDGDWMEACYCLRGTWLLNNEFWIAPTHWARVELPA